MGFIVCSVLALSLQTRYSTHCRCLQCCKQHRASSAVQWFALSCRLTDCDNVFVVCKAMVNYSVSTDLLVRETVRYLHGGGIKLLGLRGVRAFNVSYFAGGLQIEWFGKDELVGFEMVGWLFVDKWQSFIRRRWVRGLHNSLWMATKHREFLIRQIYCSWSF